jgi:demethylmenaquinone methyltransferase / 2-methoxy-6-polyprenyl-1,4-benzoquinol methylase
MSEKVKNMFAEISGKYDFMNSLLSFGMHKSWRKKTVRASETKEGDSVLDCASGTGDLAIDYKRKVGEKGKVIALDFCKEMLDLMELKLKKEKLLIEKVTGDVLNLQFEDKKFDIVSIAFGLRNLDDPVLGIREMTRVLKPGGRLAILETGQPKHIFSLFYKIYSKFIIPVMGIVFARNKYAYQYLPDTASKFPYGEKLAEMLENTGFFSKIDYYPQTFGVVYIYIAKVK